MLPAWLDSGSHRSRLGWLVLRVTLAILIGAHGLARVAAGGVVPFGGFLSPVGFPGGLWFVVGLGRNGSEYSVLLVVCLLTVGLQHVKGRAG